jgi:hypothetical protein
VLIGFSGVLAALIALFCLSLIFLHVFLKYHGLTTFELIRGKRMFDGKGRAKVISLESSDKSEVGKADH